jgi:tetratricopeptide (TPR) repeat protein
MGQARDYEALIRELLAGVAGGWSFPDVTFWLWNVGDEEGLALWLREFAKGLSLERDRELIEQLKLLGKMTPGKLASEALMIVARLDRSYEQNSELLNHEAWISTGIDLFEQERYEEAISSFDRAIEIKPDYHEIWYCRGCALRDLGRYEEAITSYDRAIEIKPDKKSWYCRGCALRDLGRYEEAITSCDRAISIDPNYHDAWYLKGIILCDGLGLYEESIINFDQAIKIDNDNSDSWNCKGIALCHLKRYEEAIVSFDQAIEIYPDDIETLINRGVALGDLGKYEESMVSYDRVIKINPNEYRAWVNRGVALYRLKLYEESSISYDRAIKITPNDYRAWCSQGILIGEIQDYPAETNAYYEAFQYIKPDIDPYGWSILKNKIGFTHYEEGKKQMFKYQGDPQHYYNLALTNYKEALQTIREEFPKLRLDTLIDTAKVSLAQDNKDAAHQYKTEAFHILRDLLNAQPPEGKKRLQIEYHSLRQLDVDLFIASGDNINALVAAEQEKNNRLTWLLSALAETTISPSYDKMRQLLGIKSVSTKLNIRGLDRAITLPLSKNSSTGIVYWHLSPDNLTTFILTANDSQPLVWESDRRQQAQQLAKWIKEWDTQYRDYGSKNGSKKSTATQPSSNGEVIKDEKEHHYWAAFTLTGEG